MSENTPGEKPAAPAAPAAAPSEQMIPKSRFDEVLNQTRAQQQELATLKQVVNHMATANQPRPAIRPVPMDPALKELKETNPAAFSLFMKQQQELARVRQVQTESIDMQDRQLMHQAFGKVAEKHSDRVEQELQRLRSQGIFNIGRSAVLKQILGEEALHRELSQGQYQAAPQPVPAQTPSPAQTFDAPPSDPSLIPSVQSGTASASLAGKTVEETRELLKNIEF